MRDFEREERERELDVLCFYMRVFDLDAQTSEKGLSLSPPLFI
jgi:hypothetical protein